MSEEKDFFITKTVDEWLDEAKKTPAANRLFGDLWFENELCILFADTNVGKSILAVQIAEAIARGNHSDNDNFSEVMRIGPLASECAGKRVGFIDFEMSPKQFAQRYTVTSAGSDHGERPFSFHANLGRAEPQPISGLGRYNTYEELFYGSLDQTIVKYKLEVLIIDNITYLADETENARSALPLMKKLKALRTKHNISIMLLAHTPKRDPSLPLSRNDLQGSKMLINFCDSSFTIGESNNDPKLRYIKQIKVRGCEMHYDSENVLLCTIEKYKDNFLCLRYRGTGRERDHLWTHAVQNRTTKQKQAIELSQKGMSLRQIERELDVSRMTVSRWLKAAGEECHNLPEDKSV